MAKDERRFQFGVNKSYADQTGTVVVSSELYIGINGHHHTPELILVKSISVSR